MKSVLDAVFSKDHLLNKISRKVAIHASTVIKSP